MPTAWTLPLIHASTIWTATATGTASEKYPSLAEPTGEGEHQQKDRSEEKEVAEGGMEAEAVVERLLADHLAFVRAFLVAELLSRVEATVRSRRNLSQDRREQQCDPVTINRSQGLQDHSFGSGTEASLEPRPVGSAR